MKRILLTLILMLSLIMTLVSCGDNGGNNGTPPTDEVGEEFIYSGNSDLYLIVGDGVSDEIITAVSKAVYNARGVAVKRRDHTAAVQEHEIILGDADRELSATAKDIIRGENYNDDTAAVAMFSDGSSVAIAWNCLLGSEIAVDAIVNELLKSDTLVLQKGYVFLDTASISAREAELWAAELAELRTVFDDETVKAIERLYSLNGDHLYEYVAGLYDPEVGGFYFSDSARDNVPFLPDIESTHRALGFLNSCGMFDGYESYATALDPSIVEKLGEYIYNMQAEDGYFYHVQWGTDINTSRRGRDLSNAASILETLGIKPKYKLATEQIADGTEEIAAILTSPLGGSVATAVSSVIAAAENNVPDYLSSKEKFIAYLDTLDFANNSYSSAHQLSATSNQIRAAGLGPVAVEYLDARQNPENGFWEAEVNYESLSGFLKVSSAYQAFGGHLKHLDKAIESVLQMIYEESDTRQIAQVYNLTNSLGNAINNLIRQNDTEMLASVRANLKANSAKIATKLYDKLLAFVRSDNTISYSPDGNGNRSQGCLVKLECVEGDIGGAALMMGAINGYFKIMDATAVKPSIYTKYDLERFNNMLTGANPVVKIELPPPEEMTMEDGTLPSWITGNLKSDGASIGVVEDSREGSNYTGYITSSPGAGDYFKVSVAGTTAAAHTALIAEADICINSCTTNGTMMQISLVDAYMIQIDVSGDRVTLAENTMTSGTDKYKTDLGVVKQIGQWFNLRVEYYIGDIDTVRIKVFIDGEHVLTSKNYYTRKPSLEGTDEQPAPATTFETLQFFCLKASNITTYIDNIYVDRSADVYDGVGEPEEKPLGEPLNLDFDGLTSPPSSIDKTFNSSGASIAIAQDPREGASGNVLKFITATGGMDTIVFSTVGLKGSCYVFEADMMQTGGSDTGVMTRITVGNFYELELRHDKDDTLTFINGYDNTLKYTKVNRGDWCKVRIECYDLGSNQFLARVFIDGTLVCEETVTNASAVMSGVSYACLSKAGFENYLDNIVVEATDATPDK